MATIRRWERPSDRTCELFRTGVELLLAAPDDGLAQVDAVTLGDIAPAIREDPGLVASIRRTNRANLTHWLEANVRDPGMPVEPNLGPETFGIARDLVRRGLDQYSLDAYRTGQNAAWRAWMAVVFTLTTDPEEVAELLDVSARSIFGFVDDTLAGIAAEVEREREHLTRGTQAARLEVVSLLLGGAPITLERASRRLGYDLDRTHTAAIVFSDAADPDPGALEEVAEALARVAGARRPLTVVASESALWTWVAAAGAEAGALREVLPADGQARVALGPALPGIEGFRRSHRDALATQRLMQRVPDAVRVATYDEVQVVALATQDEERADEFVRRTLGDLATAPPELRETLRTYLREDSNATRTARLLFAHRNTVLARLARAEALLPAPLAGHGLAVGLALEVVHWLGTD